LDRPVELVTRLSDIGRQTDHRSYEIIGTTNKSDLNAERAKRRAQWRRRAATWNLRASATDQARDERLNGLLITAADICPGAVVLDLGAGSGEPAIAAALTVGAKGMVVPLDHALEMLEGARKRATAMTLKQIQCVVGDMVELPFAEGAFDAVIARFSLMSVPDQRSALREARRVLRPGGRAAFLAWGPEAGNDRFRTLRDGMIEFFGPDAIEPSARHGLGEAGAMTELLGEAGFSGIEEHAVEDVIEIAADREIWSSRMERNYTDLINDLTLDQRTALDAVMRKAFEPYRHGEVYRLRAEVRLGMGHAPDGKG
jgi:SAM-dependent methyltransferase